jgi:hypothetical protein
LQGYKRDWTVSTFTLDHSDYEKDWFVTDSYPVYMGEIWRIQNLDIFYIHCQDREKCLLRGKQKKVNIDGKSVVKIHRNLPVLCKTSKACG